MTKYYDTSGKEWIGDVVVLANGSVRSGKTFTADSINLLTEEAAKERGIELIAHVPEKRVKKVNTKNTPTSLRKMKAEENASE